MRSLKAEVTAKHCTRVLPAETLTEIIQSLGCTPRPRNMIYGTKPPQKVSAGFTAKPLTPSFNTPLENTRGARVERSHPMRVSVSEAKRQPTDFVNRMAGNRNTMPKGIS
jgi:hypothetical protein